MLLDVAPAALQSGAMRFIAGGPDIPDELLVARDEGDVIFFCGAGVSQANAHLPNFEELSRYVIDNLGSALDSPARKLLDAAVNTGRLAGVGGLVAADRIFGLLEREFQVRDVREAVAQAITPREGYSLEAHRVLLDLATSRAGVTRLVTTNFDPLFEECASELTSWGPPRLPDPKSDREFRGIVHLHGRVSRDFSGPSDDEFVVSSADFGRAYLSDGWATRFIQALLTRYQIVFVGYSAEDPPVQYLLEALNLHAGTRSRLFAFQAGDPREASALWEQRGVEAIPFDSSSGFGPLWNSLAAWAERARDVDGWYSRTIDAARRGPAPSGPHFRGMLAKVLSTREGARQIATAPETIDASWLLTLDPRQRYAPASYVEPYDDTTQRFDPFDALGLDFDITPEPDESGNFSRRSPSEDAFDPLMETILDEEDGALANGALRGLRSREVTPMPARLISLGTWLSRVAHDPVCLWWAAQQGSLHPDIKRSITYRLRNQPEQFPDIVQKGWQWLFLAWDDTRNQANDARYDLEARANRDGWSFSLVRDVVAMYRPQLKVEPTVVGRHPLLWDSSMPDRLIGLDVEYPRPHEPLPIPDEYVAYAVAQFRANLELALALEQEITGDGYVYLTTTRADDGKVLDEDSFGLTGPVIVFQNLMTRLLALDRDAARAEVERWPKKDEYVFGRLRIWAAGLRDLLNGHEAAEILLGLPDEAFWGSHHERDLLYVLRDRWADLSVEDRRGIEVRLQTTSFPFLDDVEGGRTRAAAFYPLRRLSWLSSQGVKFTFDLGSELAKLRIVAPEWTDEATAEVATSDAPEVYTIGTDETADPLLDLPIRDILTRAAELEEMGFRDRVQREPFQGLAKRRPIRAFLALVHAARRDEAPISAWSAFLRSDARHADTPRMVGAIAARLCQLPIERFQDIAYAVSEWMREIADRLFGDASAALPPLWTRMIEVLMLGSTNSPHRTGRSWADDALNAPVGKLIDLLMKDPAREGLAVREGLPASWRERVEELLRLPGDLRRQALVMICHRTNWLFAVEPKWVELNLLPAAHGDVADGDAFWDGYLWAAQTPCTELFLLLKDALIQRALRSRREGHHGNILAGMILAGWGGAADAIEPERLISDVEFRELLIHADDEFRRQVIWNLERWSSDDEGIWRGRLLTFLRAVWPRQGALRTSSITGSLAQLALSSGELMPDVVGAILPRLVPIRGGGLHSLGSHIDDEQSPARQFPKATLDLLEAILPEDPRAWPYRTDAVLDLLAKSPDVAADPRLADLRRRRER